MTTRLVQSAELVLRRLDLSPVEPRRVGRLAASEGILLEAEGFPFALGTAARITTPGGTAVRGEVVGFRGQRSLIMPFENDAPLCVGARVEAHGDSGSVACGTALLGRVIDALGRPLDSLPPPVCDDVWPLGGKQSNPLGRGRITSALDIGVRAINGLLTVGEGQRVAIIAGSGVGKSVLIGQMIRGAACDIIVVGLVGERGREVSDFVESIAVPALREKTVVVAVPADHPPLLRLRAAMRATAIAEYFRQRGKRVFLMIDSLTRVAHAQREIGLSLGEPPTMKGYPPSALGLIPKLAERAGIDRVTGGSITAIYTVLADGGDIDDPIVDAARAIVDGHIILSRKLAEQGVYPAIDVARSLSRTMADVVDPDHARAAAKFRRLWSVYEENRDLVLMGAYTPGNDAALDEALANRGNMIGYLGQDQRSIVGIGLSREKLISEFGV
jgi:flagellum-specific ATP synthase